MLEGVWWRLDRALDPGSISASARVGGLAALRAGVTTVVDHHASPGFIVGSLELLDEALSELGLRRVLCYEVSARGGLDEARAGLRAPEALLGAEGGGERAVMVGAHASFTLSDDSLRACGALAREAGVGLHIHVAESLEDEQLTGEPLVARLERLGALVPGSVLAHAVHLSAEELRRVEDAGAWVTHQPRSNMNNAVGYAPLAAFGAHSALGTDGIGSDLFSELQAAWFRGQEGGVPWAPDRFLALLSGGARMAGEKLGVTLGRLAPGAAAARVVLDAQPGPPLTAQNLAAAMIFRLGAGAVRSVMIGGRWRLRDRQPLGLDVEALDREAQRQARALWRRIEGG
jgi:cytosine/adenosine deaminase-related metal-dependent hydrolase